MLDRLQQLGVISPISEPTPLVSSLPVAVTKSGALRICIDPRLPNIALQRDGTIGRAPGTRVFLVVDLMLRYWHCVSRSPLNLTYPQRTYAPLWKVQGDSFAFRYSASSEIFQKRTRSKTYLMFCTTSFPGPFPLHPGRCLWHRRERRRNNRVYKISSKVP